VTVFLSLLDSTGQFIASTTLQIPPQGRVSRMLTEYFPNAPQDLMASLRITATAPVGAGAIHVLFPEGKFETVSIDSLPPAACVQVITPARNPLTKECIVFPTPCDLPEGWQRVQSCVQ
jgi:hypothetical protein